MKCSSCGAEIRLTDSKCPYCGRALTEVAGHRKDKKKYQKDSEETQKKAAGILAQNHPIVVSVFCMILLMICFFAAFYVKENAYHFRDDAIRKKSAEKYDEYSVILQDYLDAEDYTGFMAFVKVHNIATWEEPYADLKILTDVATDYADLVSWVEAAKLYGPNASIYNPQYDVNNTHSVIEDFYGTYEKALEKNENDPYKDYIYDMKDKTDALLEVYLGLDEEGREEYFAGSELEQTAYLEEVLSHD